MIDYQRQIAIFNPEEFKDRGVTIIGLGNIGSHAAVCLARLGILNFNLYDPDMIEPHNLSSQSYNVGDVGAFKVKVVAEQLKAINMAILANAYQAKYSSHEEDIVIVGVDSLEARREIAFLLKKPNLIIDGRIGGEQLEIYNSKTPKEWSFTIPKGEGDDDPCGARYISYTSVIVGALIANQVKKFLRGEKLNASLMMNVNSFDIMKNYEW